MSDDVKIIGNASGLCVGLSEHLPLYGIQLVLDSVDHMGSGILVQLDVAITSGDNDLWFCVC